MSGRRAVAGRWGLERLARRGSRVEMFELMARERRNSALAKSGFWRFRMRPISEIARDCAAEGPLEGQELVGRGRERG